MKNKTWTCCVIFPFQAWNTAASICCIIHVHWVNLTHTYLLLCSSNCSGKLQNSGSLIQQSYNTVFLDILPLFKDMEPSAFLLHVSSGVQWYNFKWCTNKNKNICFVKEPAWPTCAIQQGQVQIEFLIFIHALITGAWISDSFQVMLHLDSSRSYLLEKFCLCPFFTIPGHI